MKFKKTLAIFILGVLIGSIAVFLGTGMQVEELHQEKEELKVDLFETRERLLRLEDLWESRDDDEIINEIVINLKMEGNTFSELAIKQAVQEIVRDLVGEKIASLNPYLVIKMLQDRKIEADGKEFRLELDAVVISKVLSLYLKPHAITEVPRDEP